MKELLKNKLQGAKEFKELTLRINELSIKTDYMTIGSLLEKRQEIMNDINSLNSVLKKEKESINYIETDEIKKLNKEISRVFIETYSIDNIIRKNISCELKEIKKKLNHSAPDIKLINIKI